MFGFAIGLGLFGALASALPAPSSPSAASAVTYVDLGIPSRRDFAFDADGILYVTAGGQIQRYDTLTGTKLAPFSVGGSLVGIDLSPDGLTLAVADESVVGDFNRIHLVDTATGGDTPVRFEREFGEAGTFMVAWGGDGRLLVSSQYSGSGWVPLRRYDPDTGVEEKVASVRQNTMLTPSADRRKIALAEANISSGPVHVYDVEQGAIVATENTGWFMFEVAISTTGRYVVAPSYNGAFVFGVSDTQFVPLGQIGQYASWGPLAGVYSSTRDVLFTADWGSQPGVKAYSLETLQPLVTIDPYPFQWNGNGSMGPGRMEITRDGRWLAVSIVGDVRLYSL